MTCLRAEITGRWAVIPLCEAGFTGALLIVLPRVCRPPSSHDIRGHRLPGVKLRRRCAASSDTPSTESARVRTGRRLRCNGRERAAIAVLLPGVGAMIYL